MTGTYGAILADPAWRFETRSDEGKGRSPEQHYQCMSIDDIKALPIVSYAAKDCVLFLWCLDTMLPEALEVIAAWGFTFKTVGFHWVKTNADGSPFTGMGYWTRANVELCLLATRGRPPRLNKDVRRLIMAPRREHSRKPDEVYDRIPRLVGGPYLEWFARQRRPGWDAIGNELDRFSALGDADGLSAHLESLGIEP